ncbi:hypothetical protein ACFL3S_08380 [Gemmatimonadota bacterium]
MTRRNSTMAGGLFLLSLMASPVLAQEKPSAMAHDAAGKENCMMCHSVGVMPPVPDVPASHEARGNESCLWCHAPDSPMQTTGAKATPHAEATAEMDCASCHAPGANEEATDTPATHEGRGSNSCLWCHAKAGSGAGG